MIRVAYHCDAVATSSVVARVIDRAAMQHLIFTNQDFAKAWVAHLSGEVRNARLRSEILTLKTVAERLDAANSKGTAVWDWQLGRRNS